MPGIRNYIVRIVGFLAVVAALAGLLFPVLAQAFLNNPGLNGVILAALAIGILFILRHVTRLGPEIEWMQTIEENGRTRVMPNLLRPVATMAQGRDGMPNLSPVALRSVLDGVGARLDESREISRYLISLLIFLGLLGTFWGLIRTVGAVSDVIGALDFSGKASAQGFAALKQGLMAPLNGMGTAFSASLFGLAGSLVLGFLDLQLGQAQTAFFRNLEDWLSGANKPQNTTPYLDSGEHGSSPYYLQALVEQTAENLDQLRISVLTSEEGRKSTHHTMAQLVEKLGVLADTQEELKHVLQRMADHSTGPIGLDEAAIAHLRNLSQDIRSDLRLIARIVGGAQPLPDA
jgi:hypothetical protein